MIGLRKRGVLVETMSTNKAIGTFNMLCEEQRRVAAGLLTMVSLLKILPL